MSTAAADLIEANFSEFLLSMGRAGGASERSDDEIAWTIGGSPIGYHNAVVRCTAPEGRSSALVDEWRDALRHHSLSGSWHWTPVHPRDLPRLLLEAGFDDGGDEPAMAAQISNLADVPMATELQVTPVEDSSALNEYRQILTAGFGEGPKEADWVASVFAAIGLESHSPWRHFVGRVDDDPVATASTLLTDATAGIYFVCTRPDARRRGFGAAITHEAMRHAARDGATLAVLGSSPMGQRVYERLGFRTVFSSRLFELDF
jgi:ribosomal protein S18 acetylase RimI-like enzyme